MASKNKAKEVLMSYIGALDRQDYEAALGHLADGIRIKGPAGESFNKPKEFIDMLRQYHGEYDIKKTFVDGEDVCLLYDLKTPAATVFMCSWYQVKEGKIASIQTIFDPRPFGPPPGKDTSKG